MKKPKKYNLILDSLQKLLSSKSEENISVQDVAETAGIAKGGIYYYFASKEAMLEALVRRNYETVLSKARELAEKTELPSLGRLSVIFDEFIRSSSFFTEILPRKEGKAQQDIAVLHHKHIYHLMDSLKPVITNMLEQGIKEGSFFFEKPKALADIILTVLTVKIENSLLPTTANEIKDTIDGLILLLEKGTSCARGALDFMRFDAVGGEV